LELNDIIPKIPLSLVKIRNQGLGLEVQGSLKNWNFTKSLLWIKVSNRLSGFLLTELHKTFIIVLSYCMTLFTQWKSNKKQ